MKFSMDGFRKSFSRDCESLRDIAQSILSGDHFDRDDFINAVNDIITTSNVINCVSSSDDPLFNDLSDIEIEHLEDIEKDG